MVYVLFAMLGFLAGGMSIFFALEARRKILEERQDELDVEKANAPRR
jgi:hypothetical protein